jgi:hypothetical protein
LLPGSLGVARALVGDLARPERSSSTARRAGSGLMQRVLAGCKRLGRR